MLETPVINYICIMDLIDKLKKLKEESMEWLKKAHSEGLNIAYYRGQVDAYNMLIKYLKAKEEELSN